MTSGNTVYYDLTVTQTTTPVVPSGGPIVVSTKSDGLFRPVETTDARGKVTTIAYAEAHDPAGSAVKVLKQTTTPPAGAAIARYINPLARVVALTAGTGGEARASLYSYDAMNRPVQVRVGDSLANLAAGTLTALGAAQLTYGYAFDDSSGEPRVRIDVTQPTTDTSSAGTVIQSLSFDALNQLTGETFASGGTTVTTYTPWSSVASRTLPSSAG